MESSTAWITVLSIISRVAGTMPAAMMALTVLPASSMRSKTASRVLTASGWAMRRRISLVAMPRVPSEPTSRPQRSRPGRSAALPPTMTVSPPARTSSMPSTWLLVTPYLRQWGPPAFSPALPPRVLVFWLAGSGAYWRPSLATAFCKSRVTTPGSTVAVRFSRSISRMRFMREKWSTTPPRAGTGPPVRLLAAPRGVTGRPRAWARATTRATSRALPGRTTASGFLSRR